MVVVMATAAVLMQWLKAEDPHVHLWALLSPFLLFALPAMAFTGALAVLFETLPGLRGGAGNVIYFFVWIALIAVPVGSLDKGEKVSEATYFCDFTGIVSVMSQMQQDLKKIHPDYKNGAAMTIGDTADHRKFLWNGLRWSPALDVSRLTCVLAAITVALLAALFFHRFDPASEWRLRSKKPPPAKSRRRQWRAGRRGHVDSPPHIQVRVVARPRAAARFPPDSAQTRSCRA